MLNGDPELPFLEMAWSCPAMAGFFNRHVLPTLRPGQQATSVVIEDMTYFAGRKCEVLYSLQLGDPSAGNSAQAVATFARGKWSRWIYKHHYGPNADAPSRPTPGFAVLLPEYGCLVELFPSDWALPSLSRVMDAGQIDVLSYRPHLRCVVRYGIEASEGRDAKPVVGKVYPPGPKAAQAWHALNTLHAQATEGIIIPQPIRLVEDRDLVLMEFVRGTPMQQLLDGAAARAQGEEAVRLVARALSWLHHLKFETSEVWSSHAQLEHSRQLNGRVHLVAPQLARQVDVLLDKIAPLAAQLGPGTPGWIHGDCQPSQFLFDEGRVALVDFDAACLGDAAADVGSFMAALHKESVRGRELASCFLEEYARCSGGDGLVERARVFQAAALVRMALRSFKTSPNRYGGQQPDSIPALLLQEATTCLASR